MSETTMKSVSESPQFVNLGVTTIRGIPRTLFTLIGQHGEAVGGVAAEDGGGRVSQPDAGEQLQPGRDQSVFKSRWGS